MDNRAGEMQVFLRVVETGSFSIAARQLMMAPSTVSKMIGRIEERLGVRLIERSTRRLSLTDEGRLYYERGATLLAELDNMERELAQGAGHASGILRVNASVAFGAYGLVPLLPAFWTAHPFVTVDISLSDDVVDLYLERTDIAFRVGTLGDSSLTTRKIGVARRKIVASPAYLARRGSPRTVADLEDHNCLGFNFRRAVPLWPSRSKDKGSDRPIHGNLLANNGETVRRLAVAGVGLARLADFHIRDDIDAGRLVEVPIDDIANDVEDVHALFLGGPRLPLRARVFLDFMVPRLQGFMAGM